MQRRQPVSLPSESRPTFQGAQTTPAQMAAAQTAAALAESAAAAPLFSRQRSAMAAAHPGAMGYTGAIRPPAAMPIPSAAQRQQQQQLQQQQQQQPPHQQRAPAPLPPSLQALLKPTQGAAGRGEHLASARPAQEEDAVLASLSDDFRAGGGTVDMGAYLQASLSQFQDDPAVINPANIAPRAQQSYAEPQTAAEATIASLQAATQPIQQVDLASPVGHSAIVDKRVLVDTLVARNAFIGFADGTVPVQFSDLNGTSPPDKIVKIHLAPFSFPHIFTPTTTVFDMFYFRTVYMNVRFVPSTSQYQSAQPNDLFTFELAVDSIDSSAVFLIPTEPIFFLNQPVSVAGDLSVRFQVRSPVGGGFMNCPIPPTRIHALRTATIALPPSTTFQLQGGIYIGALAPPASIFTVPILFQQFNAVASALETALINAVGYQSTNFVGPSSFDISVDTTAIPLGVADDIYVFIPKNSFCFSMRFSSLQTGKSNDLVPTHS